MLLLTAIAAGPLAAAPALARGDGGHGWNPWNDFVEWCGTGGGDQGDGDGGGTPLPGPGALGLVLLGLGTAVAFARRRQ
jgi:hypothetical protein